jgi:hypothetical protein|tara:strand:+ start:733 stop:942 length:210 start_codon:yes stop_codon:yes gene_type:complete
MNNSLSDRTVSNLATAVHESVVKQIYSDPQFLIDLSEALGRSLTELYGEMDEQLRADIGMLIFDRMTIK